MVCLITLTARQYVGADYRVTDNYEHEDEHHLLVRNDFCVPDLCNSTPTCTQFTNKFPCPLIHRDYSCVYPSVAHGGNIYGRLLTAVFHVTLYALK